MKTKVEILKHLYRVGYNEKGSIKILGYLLGAGIIEKGEKVLFHKGEGTFDDFFNWINEPNAFSEIASDLAFLLHNSAKNPSVTENIAEKINKNVQFLMENRGFLQRCMDEKDVLSNVFEDLDKLASYTAAPPVINKISQETVDRITKIIDEINKGMK